MRTIEYTVSNSEDLKCGELSAGFYESAQDLNNAVTLRVAQLATTGEYLWPLVTLSSIEVLPKFRGKGTGTAALKDFINEARNLGTKLVILKVGHFDGSTDSGRAHACRLANWYGRNGFCSIVPDGVQNAVAPLHAITCPEMLWMFQRLSITPS